jgi:FtsH-binding integral membrane protein
MVNTNRRPLYLGAAACTGTAGILHLMFVPSSIMAGIQYTLVFLISGLAQLFWVLPMVKRWGRIWNIVGLAGTTVLVGMTGYVIVESVKNPQLTPPGVLESAIAIEICQVVFVILSATIIFAKR